jgi:hypothetical protein
MVVEEKSLFNSLRAHRFQSKTFWPLPTSSVCTTQKVCGDRVSIEIGKSRADGLVLQ